jgi:hypothetical protein
MPFEIRADLAVVKAELLAKIDAEAGRMRARFITVTAGQEMVYLAKQNEALLIVADAAQGTNVPDSETPHVSAEATADQVTRFEKAVEILTIAQQWAQVSPLIETKRLAAKAAVAAAATAPVARVEAMVNWSTITERLNGQ